MKQLLLILSLTLTTLTCWGYDPTAAANANPIEYSTNPADIRIRETTVNENTDAVEYKNEAMSDVEKEAQTMKITDIVKAELTNPDSVEKAVSVKYFMNFYQYSDTTLKCPPLSQEASESYLSLIENINYENGNVTCSVYERPHSNSSMSEALKRATPFQKQKKVYTATFQNLKYLEQLKASTNNSINGLISTDALSATKLLDEKLDYAKEIMRYKFNNIADTESEVFSNSSTTASTYLNLSDVVDAVMVFDSNIIDIQSSFNQGTLVFQPGYVANYLNEDLKQQNKENREFINKVSTELNEKLDFFPVFFDPSSQSDFAESDIDLIFGTKLNMVIYFIINYYDKFEYVFFIFLICVVSYGIYQLGSFAISNFGKESERKNFKFKIGFSIATILGILTLTMNSNNLNIQGLNDNDFNIGRSQLQLGLNLLSQETNFLADTLTEGVFDSYINTLFSDGLKSEAQIRAIAKEYQKTKFIFDYQTDLFPSCLDIYDTSILRANHPEWFEKNQNLKFLPDNLIKGTKSPYNLTSLGGYVQNRLNLNKTGLSLRSCLAMQKDIESNQRRLALYQRHFDIFNDIEVKEKMYLAKEAIIEKLWIDYFKYGYIAASMIAVIDTYQTLIEFPQKKAEEWMDLISNFDSKELIKFTAENSVFVLTVGAPVQELGAKIAKLGTDSLFGWFPGLGTLSSITSEAAGWIGAVFFVDALVELIPTIRGLFIFAISTIMFMLYFVAKFVAYWLIPFALAYAFIAQPVDKLSRILIKVIITFLKPIMLIFVLFLTIFVMDFFHNYIYLGIENMTKGLILGGSIVEYTSAYLIKGIAVIFAVIIEFIVCYQLIVNGTKSLVNMFELQSNDLADSVIEGVSSVVQHKVIK